MLDALLYGRGWIGIVFVLLAGIVFFNVDLLRMNRDIAKMSERSAAVTRQNARLRTDLARLGSSERIQRAAAQAGLVLPVPGEVRYLRSHPGVDARRAAQRIAAGDATGRPAASSTPLQQQAPAVQQAPPVQQAPQQTAPQAPTATAAPPATAGPVATATPPTTAPGAPTGVRPGQ